MRIKWGQMLGTQNGGRALRTGSGCARFGAVFSIIQLWIPVSAAPLGRHVKDGPERHQVGRTARILAGIGRRGIHLAAPEMPDCTAALREYVERGVIAPVLGQRMIIAAELARDILIQRQIVPAALALEGFEPLDW